MDPNPDYDASDELEYAVNWFAWILRGVYPPPAYPPVWCVDLRNVATAIERAPTARGFWRSVSRAAALRSSPSHSTGKSHGFIEDLLRISQDVRRKLAVLARSARAHLGDRDGSAGSRNVTQSITGNDGRPGLPCPMRCERTWSNPNFWRTASVYRGCSGCAGASDRRLAPVITVLCQHAVVGGATDTTGGHNGAGSSPLACIRTDVLRRLTPPPASPPGCCQSR
jgi:hypothetical protein